MKVTLLLVVLACVMAVSYGDLVCGTKYCEQHQNSCTASVTPSSCRRPAEYRARHAGKCACCPACVTVLPEGSACKTYSKELGETPSSVCGDKFICASGVCSKRPGA